MGWQDEATSEDDDGERLEPWSIKDMVLLHADETAATPWNRVQYLRWLRHGQDQPSCIYELAALTTVRRQHRCIIYGLKSVLHHRILYPCRARCGFVCRYCSEMTITWDCIHGLHGDNSTFTKGVTNKRKTNVNIIEIMDKIQEKEIEIEKRFKNAPAGEESTPTLLQHPQSQQQQ